VEFRLDTQKLLLLVFFNGGDGYAGPAGDDFFDVFPGNDARGRVVKLEAFTQTAQIFLFLALFLGVETRFFKFVRGNGGFHAMGDELDAFLDFANFFGNACLAEFYASAGFVDEVDGFVREEAIGNVAVRKINGIAQGFIRVADGVEFFVALTNALDNLHGFFFVRSGNLNGLEAAFEGAVFFDGLAIFTRRGGADALNFATGKGGLQDIGGVEGAFGRAGADKGVEFVNEDDGILALHQFFHDGLEALFELPAIFGAGNDERKIEGEDTFVGEEGWDIAVGDALRESFDDSGLANAGFADEHGIIFRAAAEDLNDALDFAFAADERVQRAFGGGLREVAAEFREKRSFLRARRGSFFAEGARQLFAKGGEAQAALH
jgi:hypothetical protein